MDLQEGRTGHFPQTAHIVPNPCQRLAPARSRSKRNNGKMGTPPLSSETEQRISLLFAPVHCEIVPRRIGDADRPASRPR